MVLLVSLSVSQPGDVGRIDIRLVQAGPSMLEVQLRPDASWDFTDGIVNMTFAIRWETAAGGVIDSDQIDQQFQGGPPFCMLAGTPLTGNSGTGIDNVDNGGFRYKGFNVSGNQFPASCFFPAGAWVPHARFPVSGLVGCTTFEIVREDGYLTANNSNWFISLGGTGITGASQVVGPGVEMGACTVDCNGVQGGSALPGTPCTPSDQCMVNAVYNVDCVCVGEPVPLPVIASVTSNSPVCSDGTLLLSVVATGDGPLTYSWSGAGVFTPDRHQSDVAVSGAVSGGYGVIVSDACGNAEAVVPVTVAPVPVVSTGSYGPLCADDAPIVLTGTPVGGTWSGTGVTGNSFDPSVGTRTLTYTVGDGTLCSSVASTIIMVFPTPEAGFQIENAMPVVNDPVVFLNTTVGGDAYHWDFGDGVISTDRDPMHVYELPGTYTVILTAFWGDCTHSIGQEVIVDLGTGTPRGNDPGMHAWMTRDGLVVEHGHSHGGGVEVRLLDARGRLCGRHQVPGHPGRYFLPVEGASSGIWTVMLRHLDEVQVTRVLLMR